MVHDLIIIGAGSAGLFAAANVPVGWKTLLLEKTSSPGKKLLLSGTGQCNLTNNEPIKAFLNRYGENGKHLRPVLFPFSNLALVDYFEHKGLPLYAREDGKVFPVSMKSADVLNLLLDLGRNNGVTFKYRSEVNEIVQRNKPETQAIIVKTNDEIYHAKNVLVATGGESYPQTGSDGSFFSCLEHIGISLVTRRPALAPVFVRDYPYSDLSGITFQNVALLLNRKDANDVKKVEGDLLLTHKGFSGPSILEISRYVTAGDRLSINYLPQRTPGDLRLELIKNAAGSNKQITTILESVTSLPRSFLEHNCKRCNLKENEKSSHLSGREMERLANRLTNDSYEVSGSAGYSVAMTTAGGVCLDEINLRSMEAKRFSGLYFAGEVLDVDGDTGGYNLQFAFSSAKRCIESMQV